MHYSYNVVETTLTSFALNYSLPKKFGVLNFTSWLKILPTSVILSKLNLKDLFVTQYHLEQDFQSKSTLSFDSVLTSNFYIFSFGVCCLFVVSASGSTVNQNCTLIRNPDYPSPYSATTSLSYTVAKSSSGKLRADRTKIKL